MQYNRRKNLPRNLVVGQTRWAASTGRKSSCSLIRLGWHLCHVQVRSGMTFRRCENRPFRSAVDGDPVLKCLLLARCLSANAEELLREQRRSQRISVNSANSLTLSDAKEGGSERSEVQLKRPYCGRAGGVRKALPENCVDCVGGRLLGSWIFKVVYFESKSSNITSEQHASKF